MLIIIRTQCVAATTATTATKKANHTAHTHRINSLICICTHYTNALKFACYMPHAYVAKLANIVVVVVLSISLYFIIKP